MTVCFYHKSDLDGVCSAAIVKHFVPGGECALYGMDYGDRFPWDLVVGSFEEKAKKCTVYMVDFSLPPEDMQRLAELSNLVWIDHHASQKDLWTELNCDGKFQTALAACELCWEYFAPEDTSVPEAVRLLGVYDSWRRGDKEWKNRALPFQYGMRAQEDVYNPNAKVWGDLFRSSDDVMFGEAWLSPCIAQGRAILRYQAEVNRKACEAGAYEFVLTLPDPDKQPYIAKNAHGQEECIVHPGPRFKITDGKAERVPDNVMPSYRVLACNTIVFSSQFFDGFYDPEKHDVMVAYCQLATGRWKISVYTENSTIDCGAIAKVFGGGGHRKAAGFVCDILPWTVPSLAFSVSL